jgi:hypothetical protein
MPLIRFIHPPDVREYGDAPVPVEDTQARYLTAMRRAVLVTEDDLAGLKKDELVELAEELPDVAAPSKRDSKGHFVKAIVEAQEPE